MKLSILIPCYNEVLTITAVIRQCLALPIDVELVIVDDGSTDGSRRLLAAQTDPRVRVVFHEKNKGKGAAIRTAIASMTGDLAVIQDADLEYDPGELPTLLHHIQLGNADVVYGSRFMGVHRSFMFTHYVGNKVLNLVTNALYNSCLTDMETCYKMMPASLWRSLDLQGDRFEIEPEITAKLLRRHVRLLEVPITYVGRGYDEGKKIGWTDGLVALWTLIKWRTPLMKSALDQSLESLANFPAYAKWVIDWCRPYIGQRVLEVGAGRGSLARQLTHVDELVLADYEKPYVDHLKHLFRNVPHVDVHQWDVTDPSGVAPLKARGIDTIVSSNVIEHIEDHGAAVRHMAEILAPGGHLALIQPAMKFLHGSVDDGLGHIRRYEKADLSALVEAAGLQVVHARYHNPFGAFGWFVQGRILRTRAIPESSVTMFRMTFPFAHWLDQFEFAFGQSVVVVGKKP